MGGGGGRWVDVVGGGEDSGGKWVEEGAWERELGGEEDGRDFTNLGTGELKEGEEKMLSFFFFFN